MKKRRIRTKAFFLAIGFLTASMPMYPADVRAEETVITIRTAEELQELSQACISESYSEGKRISLEEDIDLTGKKFQPIPVFCGIFEGNGHTVSGISFVQPGSHLGLFRYLEEEAVVQNLNVEGDLKPGGSRKIAGGIAGTNKGVIKNCTFSGSGEALESLGGIAGVNEETGLIENCTNRAELTGNRKVGGIAGENAGTILSSHNEGEINAASEGIDEESGEKNGISVNREDIQTTIVREKVNDVGGIAGLSQGTIRQCSNKGKIGFEHTGYNIGGIAGRQNGLLVLCENEGTVTGRKDVGGIVGQLEPFLMIEYGKDTFDRINDQVDQISGTTDAMSQELRDTADASIGNLDRVDEIIKQIRDITRDKKDERRVKRGDYEDKAGRQLDSIDEILANIELDLGSSSADRAQGRVRNNINQARKLLESLKDQGVTPPDDYIFDEDEGALGQLQYLYQVLSELQECAQNITDDTQIMIEDRIDGVVDGVRDFEGELDTLRIASKEFLDLTRDYKDQLFEDIDEVDEDLTGQLDQLYDELDFLSDNIKSGKDQLRAEKDRLDGQLDEMQDILVQGKERIESERERVENDDEPLFEDISEMAADLTNGMVIGCSNQGDIFSDFQAGGVTGTIGIELGMDPEEDIETYGNSSLYMNRYAQASVRGCRNGGSIIVQQDYAGGIAGMVRIGTLAANQNYGDICTVDGDYAGGIAGSSESVISGSYAMCEVDGNDYAGGIAGIGKSLVGNCSMVNIVDNGGEWQGSIAGSRDGDGEVKENIYVADSLGAVDGITFCQEAEGISYENLLQKEGLPLEFHHLSVIFLADGQVVEQKYCQYGQSLTIEDMPEIPEKAGFFANWETESLSDIRKNYKIHAVYLPWTTVIADSQEAKPRLLAEAAFYPEAQLYVQEINKEESAAAGTSFPLGSRWIRAYRYEIRDPQNPLFPDKVKLHILRDKADWAGVIREGKIEKIEAVKDGEYLIFEAGTSGELVLIKSNRNWLVCFAVVLTAGILIIIGKKATGKRLKAKAI